MIRQGKYTKKLTPIDKLKRGIKRRWAWFKALPTFKKILLIVGPILALLIIIPLLTYAYFARDISDKERLMNRNNTGIVLLDRHGEPFYSIGRSQNGDLIPLEGIADVTEKALLSAEDKNFYEHSGFSITGILGALYANVMSLDATAYGGSTLTQQLAKNTLLSNNQTFLRKYQELAISIAIEQTYSKDEILEMYMNSVYFGENAFGIEAAADTYFGKTPAELNLAESAMLVGVLPAPSAYSPISGDPELAKERQTTVLARMVDNGVITTEEQDAALAVELAYVPQNETNDSIAPHFAEMVIAELREKYGEEKAVRSGYQVKTTLDRSLQEQLNSNIANHMQFIQANGGSNASGVAIDPKTGEIKALVGSADYSNPEWGNVNIVTTPRQPGSSFKPIYYSEALAEGVITPATVLEDVPTTFGNSYRPLNADRQFHGDVTVREALSRSFNIPSVKVMQQLGIGDAIDAAQRMGITTLKEENDYCLSLALGSAEVPLLQMTNAYAGFANQGEQYETTIIQEINNKFDDTIFTAESNLSQIISPAGSYLISSILSDQNARAPVFGSSLSVPGRTAAVKTGTTDDARDAWTIGYTPQLTVGVWVGNNNNDVMQNGGAGMAGPIWVNTMQQALANTPDTPFPRPDSIVQRNICFSNGGIANVAGEGTYREYFLSSALPDATCRVETPEEKAEKEREREEREAEKEREREEREAEQQQEEEEVTPPEEPPVEGEQPPGDGEGNGGSGDEGNPEDPPEGGDQPPEPGAGARQAGFALFG